MANPTNSAKSFNPILSTAAANSGEKRKRLDERPSDGECKACGGAVAPTKHPDGWMPPTALCFGCDYRAWRLGVAKKDKQEQYQRAIDAADIPDRAWHDAQRDDIALMKVLEAMCGVPPGERRDITSAYLYGDVGTGKSVQCAKALHRYITRWVLDSGPIMTEQGRRFVKVRYCNPERLLERHKASFDGAPAPDTETLITCDFLVVDDLGAEKGAPGEKGSDWARSQLYNIINGRYEERKLTLFTSNYALTEQDAEQMRQATGRAVELLEGHYNYSRRTVSRIWQMCGGSQGKPQTFLLTTNWRKPRGRR